MPSSLLLMFSLVLSFIDLYFPFLLVVIFLCRSIFPCLITACGFLLVVVHSFGVLFSVCFVFICCPYLFCFLVFFSLSSIEYLLSFLFFWPLHVWRRFPMIVFFVYPHLNISCCLSGSYPFVLFFVFFFVVSFAILVACLFRVVFLIVAVSVWPFSLSNCQH